MASLPLINWQMTLSIKPSSINGSSRFGILIDFLWSARSAHVRFSSSCNLKMNSFPRGIEHAIEIKITTLSKL
jgi:hypothetical protein